MIAPITMPEHRRDAERMLNKNVEYSVVPKEHPFLNLPPCVIYGSSRVCKEELERARMEKLLSYTRLIIEDIFVF